MSRIRNLFVFLLLASCTSSGAGAQSETFDITTFAAPRGWERQTGAEWVAYHTYDQAQNRMCRAWVYKGFQSSGNAQTDFSHFWQQIVATPYKLARQPAPQTRNVNGWTVLSAFASVNDQGYPYTALLHVYSGNGVAVPFFFMYDSNAYTPDIQELLASVNIKANVNNQVAAAQRTAPSAENGTTSVVGSWSRKAALSWPNPGAGYDKWEYIFQPDGTYRYHSKTFRYTSADLILTREKGTYSVSNNTITVNPQSSVTEAWSKRDNADKWERLVKRQNRALEKVTYRFAKHYFSGIQEWNFVLQTDRPTSRDGAFNGNGSFANSYLFSPVSTRDPLIELPPGTGD